MGQVLLWPGRLVWDLNASQLSNAGDYYMCGNVPCYYQQQELDELVELEFKTQGFTFSLSSHLILSVSQQSTSNSLHLFMERVLLTFIPLIMTTGAGHSTKNLMALSTVYLLIICFIMNVCCCL